MLRSCLVRDPRMPRLCFLEDALDPEDSEVWTGDQIDRGFKFTAAFIACFLGILLPI